MEEKNYKLNQQCLQNMLEINNGLALIETKGDSLMILYRIRLTLDAVLKQIQEDNEEQPAVIDNTTKKKEEK